MVDNNKDSTYGVIQLTGKEPLFTDPESEEGKFQNLLLNMMGGLTWEHLSQDEKDLCMKNGYNPSDS